MAGGAGVGVYTGGWNPSSLPAPRQVLHIIICDMYAASVPTVPIRGVHFEPCPPQSGQWVRIRLAGTSRGASVSSSMRRDGNARRL